MDGENNGKPYEQMDDLGGTTIFGNTHIYIYIQYVFAYTCICIYSPPKKEELYNNHVESRITPLKTNISPEK